MAELKITCTHTDHGLAAGGTVSELIKRLSHELDSVQQYNVVLNVADATSDTAAIAEYKAHLTANGVTWTTEGVHVHV